MIFGLIECDEKYQIGEKVRINFSKSYNVPSVDFTVVKIQPSASDLEYSATSLTDKDVWMIDWIYTSTIS